MLRVPGAIWSVGDKGRAQQASRAMAPTKHLVPLLHVGLTNDQRAQHLLDRRHTLSLHDGGRLSRLVVRRRVAGGQPDVIGLPWALRRWPQQQHNVGAADLVEGDAFQGRRYVTKCICVLQVMRKGRGALQSRTTMGCTCNQCLAMQPAWVAHTFSRRRSAEPTRLLVALTVLLQAFIACRAPQDLVERRARNGVKAGSNDDAVPARKQGLDRLERQSASANTAST